MRFSDDNLMLIIFKVFLKLLSISMLVKRVKPQRDFGDIQYIVVISSEEKKGHFPWSLQKIR